MPNLIKLPSIFNRKSTGEIKAITDAASRALGGVGNDVSLLQIESVIRTSTGLWLDEYGSWFGVFRIYGETDFDFGTRIIANATTPKNTIPSIIDSVNIATTDIKTYVFEPYTRLAKYSVTPFSGIYRYQDGVYWRNNVIEVRVPQILTDGVRELVTKIKAAGVKPYFSISHALSTEGGDFSEGYIVLMDVTLVLELSTSVFKNGTIFSKIPYRRSRSGLQTLWGVFVDKAFDLGMGKYERLTGDSPVLTHDDFTTYSLYPEVRHTAAYSDEYGLISGKTNRKIYLPSDSYASDSLTDVQARINRIVWNLRPAVRSGHAVFSGKHNLCGVIDGGWTDRPFLEPITDFIQISNMYNLDHRILYTEVPPSSILSPLYIDLELAKGKDIPLATMIRDLYYATEDKWEDFISQCKLNLPSNYPSDLPIELFDEWGINIQRDLEMDISFDVRSDDTGGRGGLSLSPTPITGNDTRNSSQANKLMAVPTGIEWTYDVGFPCVIQEILTSGNGDVIAVATGSGSGVVPDYSLYLICMSSPCTLR